MSHLKKLQLLTATALVMSAMASSAWATNCERDPKSCPPKKVDGGGGGSDSGPKGVYINQTNEAYGLGSGNNGGNTHNGYGTAGRGSGSVRESDSASAKNEKIKYDKAYKEAQTAVLNGAQGTGRVTQIFDGSDDIITKTEFDFARPDGKGIEHVEEIRNITKHNGHTIIRHYNFRDANGRNGEKRPAQQGPGSLTYIKKDGTTVKTLTPTEAHVTGAWGRTGTPGTGAAKRAALRADPVALAAAQARAREAAAAPGGQHNVSQTASAPKTLAPSVPKPPTSPPIQPVLTSVHAPSPVRAQ